MAAGGAETSQNFTSTFLNVEHFVSERPQFRTRWAPNLLIRDEQGLGLDRTGSGLKLILAGSELDRTEKMFVVLM